MINLVYGFVQTCGGWYRAWKKAERKSEKMGTKQEVAGSEEVSGKKAKGKAGKRGDDQRKTAF